MATHLPQSLPTSETGPGFGGWAKRKLLQPVTRRLMVFSGQAGHEEVKRYISENEAVQTALATRIVHLESRVRWLTWLFVALAAAEVLRWVLR
jgi:uncharacterized protein CbrC (UPF0167 family)